MADQFDLVCKLENIQGLIDALISIRWKNKQDAMVELSEHGLVIMAQELNCLQAKAYFRKELFLEYAYTADVRQRFAVSLSLLIDTANAFVSAASSSQTSAAAMLSPVLTLCYPGPDMELLLKMSVLDHVAIGAEIRTLLPSWSPEEFAIQDMPQPHAGGPVPPVSFAIRSGLLKELMEDLEWPGSDVRIMVDPQPPGVTFLAQGHGDLQIDLPFGTNNLFIDFHCPRHTEFSYKFKYLSAVTAGMPSGALKDSGGSKLTIDESGLLKVQHLVNVRQSIGSGGGGANPQRPAFSQQAFPSQDGLGARVGALPARSSSYVEFFVVPSEELEEEDMQVNE